MKLSKEELSNRHWTVLVLNENSYFLTTKNGLNNFRIAR